MTIRDISQELRKGVRSLLYPSSTVSPLPPSPAERVGTGARNFATTMAQDVIRGVPAALRSSPPGQVYEYSQGRTAQARDLIDALRAIGYLTPRAILGGGAAGTVVQAAKNVISRRPILNDTENAFAQGASDAAPFGAASVLRPFLTANPVLNKYTSVLVPDGPNKQKVIHLLPDKTKYIKY